MDWHSRAIRLKDNLIIKNTNFRFHMYIAGIVQSTDVCMFEFSCLTAFTILDIYRDDQLCLRQSIDCCCIYYINVRSLLRRIVQSFSFWRKKKRKETKAFKPTNSFPKMRNFCIKTEWHWSLSRLNCEVLHIIISGALVQINDHNIANVQCQL